MLQNPWASKCVYSSTPFWRAGPIPGRTTFYGHLRQKAFQTLACCVPPSPVLDRAGFVLRAELFVLTLKHFEGAQARVGAKQKRQWGQLGSHWQDPLQVELGLVCRLLQTRAQSQLQAIAQGAQVGRTRFEGLWYNANKPVEWSYRPHPA